MSESYEARDLALQFLVQEVLMDIGRYYERVRQRHLFRETVEGLKEDVEDYVLPDELEDDSRRELENVFGAVNDQLNSTIHTDTRSLRTYLHVFDEWCEEKLNQDSEELLDEATEEKPQAEKWLSLAREHFGSLQEFSPTSEEVKKYQNRLIERWEDLLNHFSSSGDEIE